MPEYKSTDGYPVLEGKRFWNNDLRVCEVTEIAQHENPYSDTGCVQTWHGTTHGSFDTLSGSMQPYGRLARYYQGADAETFKPGTSYADIKVH